MYLSRRLRTIARVLCTICVVFWTLGGPAFAATVTWDGSTDALWSDGTNWVGDSAPLPADTAEFVDGGNGNTTIDLGGAQTINHLLFNNASTAAYTIGIASTDTLTFENGGGIDTTNALTNDQTIAADIILGDGSANSFRIDTESLTQKVIITGDIDTGTGGTAGIQRIEIGDLGGASLGRTVRIEGDINETGDATRIDTLIGGVDLEISGNVNGTGNTQRTFIRDSATVTVEAGGSIGQGLAEVRNGTLNINSDAQSFFNTLILGDTGNQAGTATVNIGAANTLALNTGITYEDRTGNADASTASIDGGTLQITGGNRTIIVHNNPDVASTSPELTITSTITSDVGGANDDRDLVIRGANGEAEGGTILLAPSGTANSFGGVTVQSGTLQLGAGGLSSEGDFLTLSAQNNAVFAADAVANVDLLGTTHALGNGTGTPGVGGNLTFGGGTTNLIADNGFQSNVVDSVGGGKLTNVNAINYFKGTGTGVQRNGAATLSADIDFDTSGGNKQINVADGEAAVDLTISSALNTTGAASDDITVIGEGTLSFSGTIGFNGLVGEHDIVTFTNQNTILGAGADIGGQRQVRVAQRNNASLSNFDVEFDINGQDLVLRDNFQIGDASTNFGGTGVISNISVIDSVGTGRITMSGSVDGGRTITYAAGTGGANIMATLSADVHMLNGGVTFAVNDGADDIDLDFTGDVSSDLAGGRTLTKGGLGTLRISGTNNVGGIDFLSLNAGRLLFSSDANLGDNDVNLGNNTTTGNLEYTGTGETVNNQVRIGDNNATVGTRTGSGIITNSGTGTLTFSQGTFNQARTAAMTNRTLTLNGTSDIVISGNIINNNGASATVGVTKDGTNTVSLNGGANTYTGPTQVNAGQLNLGNAGTDTFASAVTVASGATIGGEGSTSGNLTLAAGSSISVNPVTPAALTTTGDLATSPSVTVNVVGSGPTPITVVNYGTFSGALGDFVLGTAATSGRGSGGFTDTGSAITLDLGFATRTWNNASADSLWNEGGAGSINWVEPADMLFFDGDAVVFDDTPGSAQTVTVSNGGAAVSPGSVLINPTNSANDYTFNAATTETLSIDSILTVANGDATTTSGGNDVVFNLPIVGTGSVFIGDGNDGVQDASQNSVQFNAASTYTGGTTIDEGRVSITNSSALGTGTITMQDGNGGAANTNRDSVLDLDANTLNIANDFSISGVNGAKVIRLDNGGATANTGTLSGSITNAEGKNNFRLETGANDILTVTGAISGNGAVTTKGPAGSGVVLANAANDFTGFLVVGSDVSVETIGNSGVASHAGAGNTIILGIQGGTGTTLAGNRRDGNLIYTGTGTSTDKQVQVGNYWFSAGNNSVRAGAITNDGTGALIFTNPTFSFQESRVAADIGPRTLTLAGGFAGVNEIQGAILNNNATDAFVDETVAVTVNTAGTWALSGASTYTGDTTITSGTLALGNGGTGGSLSASSAIVNNGVFAVNQTDTVTQGTDFSAAAITGTGEFQQNGTGTTVLNAANAYSGNTTVNAGTLQAGATDTIPGLAGNGDVFVNSPGTLDINGFGQNINGLSGNGIVDNTGAMSANLNVGNDNDSTTFSGVIQDSGAGNLNLNKVGTGTFVLSGNSTYAGTTMVNGGTLQIDGDNSGATGAVTVDSAATLSGTGTVGGATTISGTHSPGNSPGIQTFSGDLAYTDGSNVVWELIEDTTAGRGTNYDGIDIGGSLTFTGTTTFDLIFNNGPNVSFADSFWDSDQMWAVYSGVTNTPNLAGLAITTTVDGSGSSFSSSIGDFSFNQTGSNVNLVFTAAAAVPEPSSLVMLGIGLLGVSGRRRRQAKKA